MLDSVWIFGVALVIGSVLLATFAAPVAHAADVESQIDALRAAVDRLERELAEIKSRLQEATSGDRTVAPTGVADAASTKPSHSVVFEASTWDEDKQEARTITSTMRFQPIVSARSPSADGRSDSYFYIEDASGYPWFRLLDGELTNNAKEAYFASNIPNGTFLLNVVNEAEDGELGIRFFKGSHPNQWLLMIPRDRDEYKFTIIRDALFDAFVLDEDGRLLLGRLPPNVYGPALARFHVKGEVDEVQVRIEANDEQTTDIFRVVGGDGTSEYLTVTATGGVRIGQKDRPQGLVLHDTADGRAYELTVSNGELNVTPIASE